MQASVLEVGKSSLWSCLSGCLVDGLAATATPLLMPSDERAPVAVSFCFRALAAVQTLALLPNVYETGLARVPDWRLRPMYRKNG